MYLISAFVISTGGLRSGPKWRDRAANENKFSRDPDFSAALEMTH
jgi:hypothetical protein